MNKEINKKQEESNGLNPDPFLSEMILVPGGSFEMGDLFQEGASNEQPVHTVQVKDFYLAKYPVTQAQWVEIMGKNPCYDQSDLQLPVVEITWYEIQRFFERLNQLSGNTYRLPSEAEWEYAARTGGQKVRFGNGKNLASSKEINFDGQRPENQKYPFIIGGENRKKTTPVGSFAPNDLGLFDLSGNVWEYCADRWHNNYFDAPKDGSPWLQGGDEDLHVQRGGSWANQGFHCRASYRFRGLPEYRLNYVGFRVAKS